MIDHIFHVDLTFFNHIVAKSCEAVKLKDS